METKRDSMYPIRKGEILSVVITKLGNKGDGMTRIGGFVVLVPGTHVGQKMMVKVTKLVQNCAFAKVLSAVEDGG